MFDWNGDGKHDWHDDALFHTVINKTDSDNKTTASNTQGSGCLTWVIGILFILWIIGKFA